MNTLSGLRDLLQQYNAEYELIYHKEQIYSIEDAKGYFEIDQTALTLIIKVDGEYCAFVASGIHGHIDFNALKQALKCSKVKLANKNEIEKITGFSIGNIPLIGLPLPYIIDRKLLAQKYIFGGSGNEHYTLKINVADLVKINKPNIIDCVSLLDYGNK